MISPEEIKKISKLSHIEIKDEEMEEMRKSFSSVLDYVKKLQEIDTSDIEETASIINLESIMRDDVFKDNNKDLVSYFSRKNNNSLEVKKILYNED